VTLPYGWATKNGIIWSRLSPSIIPIWRLQSRKLPKIFELFTITECISANMHIIWKKINHCVFVQQSHSEKLVEDISESKRKLKIQDGNLNTGNACIVASNRFPQSSWTIQCDWNGSIQSKREASKPNYVYFRLRIDSNAIPTAILMFWSPEIQRT